MATTIGAEGLEVEAGRHLLIADAPESFADACAGLLASMDHRTELAKRAAQQVRETYSPEAIAKCTEDLYESIRTVTTSRS